MDCTDLAALLSGLIDDELDAPTRHAAERHLVDCPRCRAIVARAEQLDTRLRVSAGAWGRDDPMPEAMIHSVLRRTIGDTWALRRARRQAAAGWLAAAAALAVAATAWFADRDIFGRDRGNVIAPTMPQSPPITTSPERPRPEPRDGGAASRLAAAAPKPTRSEPSDAPDDASAVDPDDAIAPYLHGPPTMLFATMASFDEPSVPVADDDDDAGASGDGHTVVEADLSESVDAASMDAGFSEEDADALAAAAVLLRQLVEADQESFADANRVREIVEYDGLVDRLDEARDHLGGDDRAACWSAESILLRLQRGPLSQDDLRKMQQDVRQLDLPSRLERAGRRMEARRPA